MNSCECENNSLNSYNNDNNQYNSDDTDDEDDYFEFNNVLPDIKQSEYSNLTNEITFPLKNLSKFKKYFDHHTILLLENYLDPNHFFISSSHDIDFLYSLPYSYLPFKAIPPIKRLISRKYDNIDPNKSINKLKNVKEENILKNFQNLLKKIANKSDENKNETIEESKFYDNTDNKVFVCAPSYFSNQEIEFLSKSYKISTEIFKITKEGLTYNFDPTLSESKDLNSYFILQQRIFYEKISNYKLVMNQKDGQDIFKENLDIPIKVREPKPFLRRLLEYFAFWEPSLEVLCEALAEDEEVFIRKFNILLATGFHKVLASQGLCFNPVIGETCEIKKNKFYIFAEVKKSYPQFIVNYNLRWRKRVIKLDGNLQFDFKFEEEIDQFNIYLSNTNILRIMVDFDKKPIFKTYSFNLPLKYSVRGCVGELGTIGNSRACSVDSFIYVRGESISSITIYNSTKNNSSFGALFSLIPLPIINFNDVLDNHHSLIGIIIHNLGITINNIPNSEEHLKFMFSTQTKIKKAENLSEINDQILKFKEKTKVVNKNDLDLAKLKSDKILEKGKAKKMSKSNSSSKDNKDIPSIFNRTSKKSSQNIKKQDDDNNEKKLNDDKYLIIKELDEEHVKGTDKSQESISDSFDGKQNHKNKNDSFSNDSDCDSNSIKIIKKENKRKYDEDVNEDKINEKKTKNKKDLSDSSHIETNTGKMKNKNMLNLTSNNKKTSESFSIYNSDFLCPSSKDAFITHFDYYRSTEFIKRFKKLTNLINNLILTKKIHLLFLSNFVYRVIFGSYLFLNFFELKIQGNIEIIPVYLKFSIEEIDLKPLNYYKRGDKFMIYIEQNEFLNSHSKLYNNGQFWDTIYRPLPTDCIYREDFIWYFRFILSSMLKPEQSVEKMMIKDFMKKSYINAEYWNSIIETYLLKNTSILENDYIALKK